MQTLPPSPPAASSSRSPNHTPPLHPRETQHRPRRRLARSALVFALSLCVPYVASASPLPTQHLTSTHPSDSSTFVRTAQASGMAALRLVTRNVSSSFTHPIITLATYDAKQGLYQIPGGYIPLRQRFNGGFIVLSFAIAFVGSLCTLELLVRRTTNDGWRNRVLLGFAGITFGAVSTFAMHFIFNNSLSLHHPLRSGRNYPVIYLSYAPGFTVLSLVASCTAMTIAFFVMGTHLKDWNCAPGFRRRASASSSSGSSKHGTDEYGRWKASQKKEMRRGTVGVGALLHQAGAVAKWSLMETGNEGEKRGWTSAMKKNMSGKDHSPQDANFEDDEERRTKQDHKLEELDFRLGRSASYLWWFLHPTHVEQFLTPSLSLTGRLSHRFPPWLNSGGAHAISAPSSDVFVPGFNFPPRVETETNSSTVSLLAKPGSNSAVAPYLWRPESPQFDGSLPQNLPDLSRRRASLPIAIPNPPRPEASILRNGPTLTRIQSMAEADQDPVQHVQSPSDDKKHVAGLPEMAVMGQLHDLEEVRDPSLPGKKVRIVDKPALSKVEGFLGFDSVSPSDIAKVLITGTVAGLGVASMHYIGQASITGMPYIAYKPAYVVGSIVIASGAVVIALYIMFIMLRPKLKHTWLSKLMVAAILSVAVCSMHFCGMMGTIYAWPRGEGIAEHDILHGTNRAITALVATLAFLACLACGVLLFLQSRRLQKERARQRRVVVASVLLDEHDRVLVDSTDGLLPMCDIASLSGSGDMPSSRRSIKSGRETISSDSTVLGMDLTTGHDAFVAAVRMSWSWKHPNVTLGNTASQTSDISQPVQQTLAGAIADIRRGSLLTMDSGAPTARQMRVSVTKFLERFAISSSQLASRLMGQQEGISRLGVLYDQILTTGWVKLADSNDTVSKGQLIFLVRRVTSAQERTNFIARNYIFADYEAVGSALHKTLSVPLEHTLPLLEDIRLFCDSTMQSALKPATLYAGIAVVQATPFDGLRVLLAQDNRSQLPMREICPIGKAMHHMEGLSGTLEELGEAITLLEGMSLLSVITRNMTAESEQLGGPRVSRLLTALERAIVPMLDDMLTADDMAHILPRLNLHPVLVPLTPGATTRTSKPNGYVPPYIVIFYANYDAAVNTYTDKWLPYSLFRAQNACVMAPQIQTASRAGQVGDANIDTSSEPADYNYLRRPSRVQFEFPLQSMDEKEISPASSPNDVMTASSINAFAFPSRSETSFTQAVSRNTSTKGSGPRRTFLAQSRLNSISAEGGQQSQSYDGMVDKDVPIQSSIDLAPGVASWDPDWLIVLLRTKLRADA